jgi:sec-independent protein translocase protein TatC
MRIRKKQATTTKAGRISYPEHSAVDKKQPFIQHAQELRQRIYYIAGSVVLAGTAIYFIQQHVVHVLLKPAHGQSFIYTSPGGGIDFLFKVCIYSGLIVSTPVIVYNLLGFISPLISKSSRRFAVKISIISTLLAIAGVFFGYFIGLPAALHFLLHQFSTVQIKPLVTIQSYLNFVMAYILGSSLLFQLPIALICINRIKPLDPKKLFHYERWVILAAFVLSGLMNPTPNIVSQLFIAGPFILMYQVGIGIIAVTNRSKYSGEVKKLMERDNLLREQRLSLAKQGLIVKADEVKTQVAQVAAIAEGKIEIAHETAQQIIQVVIAEKPVVEKPKRTLMGQPLTGERTDYYAKYRPDDPNHESGKHMDFMPNS